MQITTKRLVLRGYKPSDYKAVNEYTSDPEVVKLVPFGPSTIAETKDFIKKSIGYYKMKNQKSFQFALTLKRSKKLIGGIGIEIKDSENKQGTFGYVLNRKYWRKGYMTEAANAILDFGFNNLKMHRITAVCRPENIASKKLMKKLGMRYEGRLKHDIFMKGKWQDSLLFAMLSEDFNK